MDVLMNRHKMKLKYRLNYWFLCAVAYPVSVLPLRVLYVFSDIIAFLACHVVRYRVRVVRSNIEESFPGMDVKEQRSIERGFYRWLADYFMETLKLLTMTPARMRRHLEVANPEVVSDALNGGRNVTLFLGHYCNWEWVSSLPLWFPRDAVCAQVYHPLHNKGMDRLFMSIRTRFGANNESMKDILRFLIGCKRAGKPTVTGFIADQRPKWEAHLFVDFLNHDTPVFTGPERISKFLDAEVYYCHMSRPRRGVYRLEFRPVTMTPKRDEEFDITRRCFDMLQDNIEENPRYYLWSHKRWKFTRAMYRDYWGDRFDEMFSHL